jgi:hypothetical protein
MVLHLLTRSVSRSALAVRASSVLSTHIRPTDTCQETPMYDMYPDWGPASHHPENPRSVENTLEAVQRSLDLRDNGGGRPDDN